MLITVISESSLVLNDFIFESASDRDWYLVISVTLLSKYLIILDGYIVFYRTGMQFI